MIISKLFNTKPTSTQSIQPRPFLYSPKGQRSNRKQDENITTRKRLLNLMFSSYGLVTMLIIIFLVGVVLGLIPLFLKRSSSISTFDNKTNDFLASISLTTLNPKNFTGGSEINTGTSAQSNSNSIYSSSTSSSSVDSNFTAKFSSSLWSKLINNEETSPLIASVDSTNVETSTSSSTKIQNNIFNSSVEYFTSVDSTNGINQTNSKLTTDSNYQNTLVLNPNNSTLPSVDFTENSETLTTLSQNQSYLDTTGISSFNDPTFENLEYSTINMNFLINSTIKMTTENQESTLLNNYENVSSVNSIDFSTEYSKNIMTTENQELNVSNYFSTLGNDISSNSNHSTAEYSENKMTTEINSETTLLNYFSNVENSTDSENSQSTVSNYFSNLDNASLFNYNDSSTESPEITMTSDHLSNEENFSTIENSKNIMTTENSDTTFRDSSQMVIENSSESFTTTLFSDFSTENISPSGIFTNFAAETKEFTQFTTENSTPTTSIIMTTAETCVLDTSKPLEPTTCPNNSIYESTSLTKYSATFGRPVFQIILCFGSKFQIKCPSNQLIHIYSAYFGMQSKNSINYCSSNKDLTCYRNLTFNYVKDLCENKNFCNIIVTDTYLGNPCPSSNLNDNQFLLQYQCIENSSEFSLINSCSSNENMTSICPSLENPSQQRQQSWCEPSSMSIRCSTGRVIRILCAFYGIDPNLKCTGFNYRGAPSKCFSQSSFTKVQNQCNGKSSCAFAGDTTFEQDSGFVNACPGYQNMLFVQWECVLSGSLTTASALTNQTTLPVCKNYTRPNGQCSSDYSPYEPKYLVNSTISYFGYSIYQQIVCQNSRLFISCPTDLVIHIHSAYFGIQSYTTTSLCTATLGQLPEMCYIKNAFDTINSTCEYKNSCQLRANVNSLGGADLCPLYQKQLVVQYQCVDSFALNSTINQCNLNKNVPLICPAVVSGVNENTWCDGSSLSISCDTGQKIEIVCAFYGIHPSLAACGISSLSYQPVCYFKSSFNYVNSTCSNKNSCTIDSFTSVFSDPCSGLDKALYVQWKCLF